LSELRARLRRGDDQPGKRIAGYPLEQLYEEIAFIAYYLHWPMRELMHVDHLERRRWCEEVSKLNRKLSPEPENIFAV
jgi:hypothetical protein